MCYKAQAYDDHLSSLDLGNQPVTRTICVAPDFEFVLCATAAAFVAVHNSVWRSCGVLSNAQTSI